MPGPRPTTARPKRSLGTRGWAARCAATSRRSRCATPETLAPLKSGLLRDETRPITSYPLLAIFTPEGRLIGDGFADAESGQKDTNVGIPQLDWEIAYFARLLRRAAPTFGDADLDEVSSYLRRRARAFDAPVADTGAKDAELRKALAAGDLSRGVEIARELADGPQADTERVREYAQLLAQKGDFAEAARQWLRATGEVQQTDADAFYSMVLNARANDPAAFQETVKRLRRLYPTIIPQQRVIWEIVEGLLGGETGLIAGGRVDRIAKEYAEVLTDPTSLYARIDLALLVARADRLDEAERMLRAEQELRPPFRGNAEMEEYTRLALAYVLAREDKRDEAKGVLAEADRFAPKDSDAVRNGRGGNDAANVGLRQEIRRLLPEPVKTPGASPLLGTLAPSLGLAYALRRRLFQ